MGIKNKFFKILKSPKELSISFENIEAFETVSFDVFDTLLKRDVKYPTDVFSIMAEMIDDTELSKNFKKQRILAEKRARNNQDKKEITIEDIYKNFSNLSSHDRLEFIELETSIEAKYLHANKDIVEIYKKCLASGKKVFIISDMYLPKDFIASVLEREGICGYDQLFVSSDCNKVKWDGSLFSYIKEKEDLIYDKWIHIGDSYSADKLAPEELGITSLHIPTFYSKLYGTALDKDTLSTNILTSFINNRISNDSTQYYRFGYNYFGPFLWGYTNWLYEKFKQTQPEKVFFFARDGFIMKKAFEILFSGEFSIRYLEVSRKALRTPILFLDCELETIIDMLPPSGFFTLEMLLDCVGISYEEISDIISEFSFKKEQIFEASKILSDQIFLKFYKKITPIIVEKSKEAHELVKGYFEQNSVNGKFAIVDIGWSGGMQRFLIESLKKLEVNAEITGYYTGVVPYVKRNLKVNPNLKMYGYLFDFLNNPDAVDLRKGYVGLFETLFLERNGSVSGYTKEINGNVQACRLPYEYLDENGLPSFELKAIQAIQEAALQFIEDVAHSDCINIEDYTAKDLFAGIYQVGRHPSKRDINLFGCFRFFDEGTQNQLANPKPLIQYILYPTSFFNDLRHSRWKYGFLKKLFRINFY